MLQNKFIQWLALILLAIIWGSSFILIKKSLEHLTPIQVGTGRLLIAGLALLPFGIRKISLIKPESWKFLAIVGIMGSGIPAILFAVAQKTLESSIAGMLNSMVPFFTLILGYTIFKIDVTKSQIYGVLVGLIGAILLLSNGFQVNSNQIIPGLLVLLATICYATSVNTVKKYLSQYGSKLISSISIGMAGLCSGIYFFAFTPIENIDFSNQGHLMSITALIGLALFGTAGALLVFNMLIRYVSAIYASSVTYLIPIVAIMWGVYDGEQLSIWHYGGMCAIFLGVYLVNKKS